MKAHTKKIGLKFFLPTLVLLLVSLLFSYYQLVIFFVFVILFMLYFLRDPDREIPKSGIVSPADGKVKEINLSDDGLKISIFMGPFDVHVNRTPMKGLVREIKHHSGKHVPAFTKESEKNERSIVAIENDNLEIKIVQIAGFMARRIYSFIEEGEELERGSRIGIIAFGSRVNLMLPSRFDKEDLLIEENDKVKAGETIITKHW